MSWYPFNCNHIQNLYFYLALSLYMLGFSLMALWVKNSLAMQGTQETQIRSLGWEDPLEEEMETHSSILAWKIPWIEESSGLWSKGSQRVRHDWAAAVTLKGAAHTFICKWPGPSISEDSLDFSTPESLTGGPMDLYGQESRVLPPTNHCQTWNS